MLSKCFPLELSLKLRFCKCVKGILLKRSKLIKNIAAMAQRNPFSVYSNNCNELDDKHGANFYMCTNRIVNEWNNRQHTLVIKMMVSNLFQPIMVTMLFSP